MPAAGSVSTKRVGTERDAAQVVQRSSSESSIQAAGRSPAYSSIALSFQCAVPKTARPSNVRYGSSSLG